MTVSAATTDRVLVDVTISAPIDRVWTALRDPAEIKRWFGWDADSLTDEIEYIFLTHAKSDEAARTIVFDDIADRFKVEDLGDGRTRVQVIRAAPAGESWEDVFDDMTEGWISFVQQLAYALDHQPGRERRTIFMSGAAADPTTPRPIEALGLADVVSLRPGSAYRAMAAPGDPLSGKVFFRDKRQAGMSVDSFGNGLLVVVDRDTSQGGGMATLTTYGLDDAAFTDLEHRWRTWWSERYPSKATNTCDPAPA